LYRRIRLFWAIRNMPSTVWPFMKTHHNRYGLWRQQPLLRDKYWSIPFAGVSSFLPTESEACIVETATGGPRLTLDLEHWGSIFGSSQGTSSLNSLLIPDLDLSPLLGGGKVSRIPKNAEKGLPDEQPLFATGLFPSWAGCLDYKPYFLHHLDEKGRTNCPVCLKKKAGFSLSSKPLVLSGHIGMAIWTMSTGKPPFTRRGRTAQGRSSQRANCYEVLRPKSKGE
jgi:hypothetical protein